MISPHNYGTFIHSNIPSEHLRNIYQHNFVTVPNALRKQGNGSETKSLDVQTFGDIYQVPDDCFPPCTSSGSPTLDLLVGGFPW